MRLRRTHNNSTSTHAASGRTQTGQVKLLRKRARGQAVVEMALLGLFLAMLMAAAVDFGRAYYTAVIIENMAGEGAAYAALYPERELGDDSCTIESYSDNESIQRRVRDLAMDRGLVLEAEDRATSDIEVTVGNNLKSCRKRCQGEAITVKIKYELDDLFLPGMLGIKSIPITQSATQLILRDVPENRSCN
ncbi:MAG TPA: TadE family protein [Chloroflexia bacterium]